MIILTFDTSLSLGWASNQSGGVVHGTALFHNYTFDHAVLGRNLRDYANVRIEETKPDVIVIEAPFFHPKHPGPARLLNGLVWEIHRAAELYGLPRYEYTPNELKKHTTGNGWAKKAEMIEAVKKLGYKPNNDNEADAIALLLMHQDIVKRNSENA